MREEEGDFFPDASRTLGKEVTEGLISPYLAKKQEAAKEMRQ
jgi:hypothetical protein